MKRWTWHSTLTRAALAATLLSGLVACGGGGDGTPDPNPASPSAVSPLRHTSNGDVLGSENATTYSFKGIPYAAPPVGPLRWKAPVAPADWSVARSATSFGNHCPQVTTPFGTASTSEDCLYLNVYAPKTSGKHPVMVWIHGGAFYLGQGEDYNPTRLVEQGIVVVTINYRLGALGFLSHPALTAENSTSSGNYGLMDQQAALRWVQTNIDGFGGDKTKVTIAGESAGGFSVHSHLASLGSAGLFHRAIIQSGAYALAAGAQDTLSAAETKGGTMAVAAAAILSKATGTSVPTCTTASCLRALPVSVLLGAQQVAWPSGPIPSLDGTVLTQSVFAELSAGSYNKVPVLQGSNKDEWRLFVALDELTPQSQSRKSYGGAPLTATTYPDAIVGTFPYLAMSPFPADFATTTLPVDRYPASNYTSISSDHPESIAMGALGTDLLFACNARWSSKLQLAASQTVYAYEFADDTAPATVAPVTFSQGAAHTAELQYLFDLPNRPALTTAQQAVASTMVGYWAQFVKTGNPNSSVAPNAWAPFGTGGDNPVLSFNPVGTTTLTDAAFNAAHKCTKIWTPYAI